MLTGHEQRLNTTLGYLAESLDIPPSKYQQAVERYEAVGHWIEEGQYPGCQSPPKVYPQGSIRLGTVVRPLKGGEEADYDIDLVSELQQHKTATHPANLKNSVGNRLKEHAAYQKMLDKEGRRCWTLQYAEEDGIGFHIDILPCLPDPDLARQAAVLHAVPSEYAQHAVALTEKDKTAKTYFWKEGGSNPAGFAEWFEGVNRPMQVKLAARQKHNLFEGHRTIFSSVEAVPDALVRTPLQQAIQILKRHRDMRFLGHKWEKDKPISMIVTTLAARAYQQEEDVYSALVNIVARLREYAILLTPGAVLNEDVATRLIDRQDGHWVISNPVNPSEDFADRWGDPGCHGAEAFFHWVDWVQKDLHNALEAKTLSESKMFLTPIFGRRAVEAAIARSSPPEKPAPLYSTVAISSPDKPWSPDGF